MSFLFYFDNCNVRKFREKANHIYLKKCAGITVNDTTSLEGSKILVDTETLSGLVTVEKHLPFFEIVADHNWSPSAHGYPTVTVLHGTEVFYRCRV